MFARDKQVTSPLAAPFLAVLIWLGLWYPAPLFAQRDQPVVIVNSSVTLTTLSRNQLRAIFALRLKVWPNGEAIRVHVFPSESAIHQRFCVHLLRIFPYQLQRVWDRLLYSGLGQAPHVVRDAREMEDSVAALRGAIGYLGHLPKRRDVRVVEVEP